MRAVSQSTLTSTEILDKRGSDLHFIAGDPPRIRLFGDLRRCGPTSSKRSS